MASVNGPFFWPEAVQKRNWKQFWNKYLENTIFSARGREQPRKNRGKGGYINNKIEYYDIKTRDFPDKHLHGFAYCLVYCVGASAIAGWNMSSTPVCWCKGDILNIKLIIMKYFFLFGFVALLPPKLYLIGLVMIYWSMLRGGLGIFTTLLDTPSTKRLFNSVQTIYMKNKMIKNGATTSSVSTSSPLPSSGAAASAKIPWRTR